MMNRMSKQFIVILFVSICLFLTSALIVFAQSDLEDTIQEGSSMAGEKIKNKSAEKAKELPRDLFNILNLFTNDSDSTEGVTPNPEEQTTLYPNGGSTPIDDLLQGEEVIYSKDTVESVKTCMRNIHVYKAAEHKTGVPWKILAGIHYVEGGCASNLSCVSGRVIGINEPDLDGNCKGSSGEGQPISLPKGGCGFRSLVDSCIYGANHLKGKIGGAVPTTIQQLAISLGRYNGLGNANCGRVYATMPYCPAPYENFDHIYPFSKFDAIHQKMYLVYCADYTKCNPPKEFTRIGVLTVAKILTQLGY